MNKYKNADSMDVLGMINEYSQFMTSYVKMMDSMENQSAKVKSYPLSRYVFRKENTTRWYPNYGDLSTMIQIRYEYIVLMMVVLK